MAETKNTEKQNIEIQKEEEKRESVRKADAAVKSMHDFTSPEVLYQELIKSVKKYHPSTDISMIEKAYKVASEAHKDQKRKSGEPYIIHPLCVAIILADLELDKETIVAGLLHDAVEDTWMTYEEVEKEFGSEVALLVDGVTKLGQLSYSKDKVEVQAENLRKMFLAMAKDIRVILIKLADRLHNMRTLQYMRPEKQQEKARETMDIYAPIAMRLGISKIKVELDDLSLKYLKPDVYYDLVEKVALRKSAREEFVNSIVKQVKQHMEDANIRAQVDGRVKHFFSIYKKMVNQDKTIDQIYDLFAVRIIVDTVKDCYAALGVIHEMYKPIPGRFKDYIAMPKANMYQSLHTTLIGPNGQPFEIQIRTFEMHKTAEYGIAAHWKYKETSDGKKPGKSEEEKLNWLRQILEWQRDMSDNREFMSLLKNDLDLFAVESGGLAGAHAIHNGLTCIKDCHHLYHGEKVAFGTLTQLVLENADEDLLDEVITFCMDVGLPTTFADLGIEHPDKDALMEAATLAASPDDTLGNEPLEVTPDKVYAAMVGADALGRYYKGL